MYLLVHYSVMRVKETVALDYIAFENSFFQYAEVNHKSTYCILQNYIEFCNYLRKCAFLF